MKIKSYECTEEKSGDPAKISTLEKRMIKFILENKISEISTKNYIMKLTYYAGKHLKRVNFRCTEKMFGRYFYKKIIVEM